MRLTSVIVSVIFIMMLFTEIESLSKRRFCQHRRQPGVSWVVIDGE